MNMDLSELSHDGRPLPNLPGLFNEKSNVSHTLQGSKNVLVSTVNSINNNIKRDSYANINYSDPFAESMNSSRGNEKRSLQMYDEGNKENYANQSLGTIFDKFVSSPIKSKNNLNNSRIIEESKAGSKNIKESMFSKDVGNFKSNEGIAECIGYLMKKIKGYETNENKFKEIIKEKDSRINQLEVKLSETQNTMDGMKHTIKESSVVIEKLKQSSYQTTPISYNHNENSKDSIKGQLSSVNNSMNESMQDLYKKELSDLHKKVSGLTVDKKVLKEIIREMIMENKKDKNNKNDTSVEINQRNKDKSFDRKNESYHDSGRRTGRSRRDRNRSKSRASVNSYVSRECSTSYSKKGDQDTMKIIKNPNFAKVINFDE